MKLTLLFVLLCAFAMRGWAEPLQKVVRRPEGTTLDQKLAPTDPDAVRVSGALQAYFGTKFSDTNFSGIYRLDQDTDLRALLPDWRFFRLKGVIGTNSTPEPHTTVQVTFNVGLSPTNSVVLPREGDNAEFGTLLKTARVPARTETQRITIQNAYRALYGRKIGLVSVVPSLAAPDSERPSAAISLALDVDADGLVNEVKLRSFSGNTGQ